jgi:hypothetical protein
VTVLAIAAAFALPSPSWAQSPEADHLTCFKVKGEDPEKVKETVDLDVPALSMALADCPLKTLVKMLCLPSVKNTGNDFRGPARQSGLLCYEAKCKNAVPAVDPPFLNSQFDGHDLEPLTNKKVKFVCAPSSTSD